MLMLNFLFQTAGLEVYMLDSRLFNEIFFQSTIPQTIAARDFSQWVYNPAFCNYLGYSHDELKGISVQDVSHPEDMELDSILFAETLSGERNEYQIEKRYIHKSGVIITGILNVSKVQDKTTGEEFFLGQILDISEKKQIENILRNREQKYRLLAEHSSDVIMSHDLDFTFKYISPSVQAILGYKPDEMVGKKPKEFIHPEDRKELREQPPFNRTHNSRVVTYRFRKNDGTYIWLESTIKALFNESTDQIKEIITVSRDIQLRMETYERFQKSEKLAVVGQTAAAVAHEIRNPLTAIKGFMQLFSTEKEINPAFVTIILDELDRVETIISEFLTMAKPHAEKSVSIRIDHIMEQVIQLLQTQALMKNKELNIRILDPMSPITGDPNSLKQVFMNVIQNSLDAITELGKIDISIFADPNGINVKITDNGCGISKERISKLGEPFYSTKEKGTGLGLMTSYRIIANHNGKISVESTEGEG
ncbi:MAG: sensor signal transduction histidine kinase, partial [Neobacillus sp.]|nr:sensor signal transduction histidine kinase [Neobacillus sp.]